MANAPAPMTAGPWRPRKVFVLCFDGTGNKFQGDEGDSNILKIFSMLDRTSSQQYHYYQPGIGTYVTSTSYSHSGLVARLSQWYKKAKDAAIGTFFAEHVMGGYKFLMQHYVTGDDLYFFGFSRGAYTARFLAEMLDHVGLLCAGNDELVRFAWKAFAQWQQRPTGADEEGRRKKVEMFNFMKAFRETFSRPVRRIRFLGLFDTVNSVPAFEAAWLQRKSKFPYTARSSALVIRHAVAIDERRAKFRQDLIAPTNTAVRKQSRRRMARSGWARRLSRRPPPTRANGTVTDEDRAGDEAADQSVDPMDPMDHDRFRQPSRVREPNRSDDEASARDQLSLHDRRGRSKTPVGGLTAQRGRSTSKLASRGGSQVSLPLSVAAAHRDDLGSDEGDEQDIEEVWFPGNHADIGGGWATDADEHLLSHGPLVWMVREARRAGLELDESRMRRLAVIDEDLEALNAFHFPQNELDPNRHRIPQLHVSEAPGQPTPTMPTQTAQATFADRMHRAATRSSLHDCLEFGQGLPPSSVIPWKIMEYMPFTRMDLQPDGWKAVRWPLPMGEVRDIPETAWIHGTAIRRMQADPSYRPGNLIVGGGGRGVRKAPPEYGTGEWTVIKGEGDIVGEIFRRKNREPQDKQRGEEAEVTSVIKDGRSCPTNPF